MVLKNRYQLRRDSYSPIREPRLIKFKFSERVVRGARRRDLPGWRLLSRQLAERNASMEHRWHRHHRMHRGNERRNGQAVIALYRHYKNGHRPISTFYSVGSTHGCYAPIHEIRDGACTVPLHFWHIWRDHMLKAFGAALLLVSALAMTADPARALQVVVTQVDKNTDGSMTYHFAVKTDPGETLTPGASKATGDFVTVYNFYGLIDGSAKVPAGWEF